MICETYGLLITIGRFISIYQTLIAGAVASAVGYYAIGPALRQLGFMQVQTMIARREVLIARLRITGQNRGEAHKAIAAITDEFNYQLYYPDPEGEPIIGAEWAHGAEQIVDQTITILENQNARKSDSAVIDERRSDLITAAQELSKCLEAIHLPHSFDFDGPDSPLSTDEAVIEEAKAAEQERVARAVLTSRIQEVSKAGGALDDAFKATVANLRERMRTADEKIVQADA